MTTNQLKAIESDAENLAVIAAPGSGKTAILCERIKHVIQNGTPHEGIVVVTFTMSAAMELQERLDYWSGCTLRRLYHVGTIHSLMIKYLNSLGLKVSMLSERETEETILETFRERGDFKADGSLKFSRKSFDLIFRSGPSYFDRMRADEQWELAAYAIWKKMSDNRVLSFDALLYKGLREIQREGFQCAHMFIDEAQDLAPMEWRIVEAIKADQRTYVGDVNQSAFAWRGADPKYFGRMAK